MPAEKAIVEIERLIERGRVQSVRDRYWLGLYGAELRGVRQARDDMLEARKLGLDPIPYLRQRIQALDSTVDWRLPIELFERSIAVCMGYKEVLHALVIVRAQDRIRPRQVARAVRDPDLGLDP